MRNYTPESGQARFTDCFYRLTHEPYLRFQQWRNGTWLDEAGGLSTALAWGFNRGRIGYFKVTHIPMSPWFWAAIFGVLACFVLRKWMWTTHTERRYERFNFSPRPWMSYVLMSLSLLFAGGTVAGNIALAVLVAATMWFVAAWQGEQAQMARTEQAQREVVA